MENGFEVVRSGKEISKRMLRKEDYLSFATKRSCVWQTHGFKKKRAKENNIEYGWK